MYIYIYIYMYTYIYIYTVGVHARSKKISFIAVASGLYMSKYTVLGFLFYLFALLSTYLEEASRRYKSSLRRCRLSIYHSKMGEIPLSAFPDGTTSKLVGFLHTIPLMLNVKQGSCEYQSFKSLV